MSLELLHTTAADSAMYSSRKLDSTEYFIPLPDAYKQGILDLSSITPTTIPEATQLLMRGKMPKNGGIVSALNCETLPDQALDLVGIRRLSRTSALVIPLPKIAVNNKDKRIQQGGVVFLTNTNGVYTPVAKIYDLQRPGDRLEADFLGIPRIAGALAIQSLSGFEHGRYEVHDTNSDGGTIIKESARYF